MPASSWPWEACVQTYVAIVGIDGLEVFKRQAGYARTLQLIDELRDDVARQLPDARELRANRASVEFAFQSASPAIAEALLRELRETLTGTVLLGGCSLPRTATIAAAPCHEPISEQAVLQAEALLEKARQRDVPVLVAAGSTDDTDDHRLMRDLCAAMEMDAHEPGLALHYQPKLHTRSGKLAGAEALLRWTHPLHGPVPPDRFVAVAERSGDIEALTHWVLGRALADQRALVAAELVVPLHVNISAPLLARPDFVAATLAQIAGYEQQIGFEITETAMIVDPEGTLARLHEIAATGVRLSIDDYGSGFSSLAYLRRLPVHEIKIDQMFVSGLATSPRDPLLVRSTINLAHALEMEVTAEGVENAAVLALLQVMGCDMVQGYFISRPLPLDGLVGFVHAAKTGAALPRPVSLRERLAQRRTHQEETR